jgi:hypothetical protein
MERRTGQVTRHAFSLTTFLVVVGRMNDQNSKYTEAYSLLDIKASYTFTI